MFKKFFNLIDANQLETDDIPIGSIIDSGRNSSLREDTYRNTKISLDPNWIEFSNDLTEKYSNYFFVSFVGIKKNKTEGFHVYSFNIKSIINEEIDLIIHKRYSDFLILRKLIDQNMTVYLPDLPQKQLMLTKEGLQKRAENLTQWLLEVSNSKVYHSATLFEFIGLPDYLLTAYLSLNPFRILQEKFEFSITVQGIEHMKQSDTDEGFSLYLITIEIIEKEMKDLAVCYTIKRRFNEFLSLNRYLRQVFKDYKKELPQLPSKLGIMFNSSSSLEQRRVKLEAYLQKLIVYPNVFDLIFFRKFLMIEPGKFMEFKAIRHEAPHIPTQLIDELARDESEKSVLSK